MDNSTLKTIWQNVGLEYGYKAEAEFYPHADFKMTWHRTDSWIAVEVCDYLADTTPRQMTALARSMFQKITGQGSGAYPKSLKAHVTAKGFAKKHQDTYIGRKDYTRSERLEKVAQHLVEMGYLPEGSIDGIAYCTGDDLGFDSSVSLLMKVVAIDNVAMDGNEDCIERMIMDETAKIVAGFDPYNSEEHQKKVEAIASAYPSAE